MLLLVDCHYGNYLAASVFFNMRIVSKSHTEFSPPIGAFMELRSNANFPCLVNLAPCMLKHFLLKNHCLFGNL